MVKQSIISIIIIITITVLAGGRAKDRFEKRKLHVIGVSQLLGQQNPRDIWGRGREKNLQYGQVASVHVVCFVGKIFLGTENWGNSCPPPPYSASLELLGHKVSYY